MAIDVVLKFLAQYDWIYNFKVTQFFCGKHWELIPKEWEECLLSLSSQELNELPFGYTKDDWPSSLKSFVQHALSFCHDRNPIQLPEVAIEHPLRRGMSPKKQHEVSKMAAFVHLASERAGCDIIVDVGSGLGYLGQVLQSTYGYKILGLESEESHTSRAERRGADNPANDIRNVTFKLERTEECLHHFQSLIADACKQFNSLTKKSEQIPPITLATAHNEDLRSPNESNIGEKFSTATNEKNAVNVVPCLSQLQEETEKGYFISGNCSSRASDEQPVVVLVDQNSPTVQPVNVLIDRSPPSDIKNNLTFFKDKINVADDPRVCLIGLHCCGDLTPTMIEFFTKLDCVKVLCCVSCCFHRMEFDDKKKKIKNFPVSEVVAEALDQVSGDVGSWNLTGYGLRLAAQETRSRWRHQSNHDHQFHMKNVAYRGLLELYLKSESVQSEKLVRKLTKKSDTESFPRYIETVLQNMKMETETALTLDRELVTSKLLQLYEENINSFHYIEPFTALQVIMQPVLESLLYSDRQSWLIEQGFEADVVPIFDESVSPRNLALTAFKDGIT